MKFKSLSLLFSLLFLFAQGVSAETVLITGSNSGIGLEFARTYADMGWKVYATHRRDTTPDTLQALADEYDNVFPERMDITDHDQVDALAARLEGEPIDVVINNAGILAQNAQNQVLGNMDFELFELYLKTNTIGAAKVTEAFRNNLAASGNGKAIAISTDMASITVDDPRRGIYYYYTSKAALNMIMKRMAKELADMGIVTGLIHPGFVADRGTPMDAPVPPGFPPLVAIDVTVPSMIELIENWKMEDTGQFYQYDGTVMPW